MEFTVKFATGRDTLQLLVLQYGVFVLQLYCMSKPSYNCSVTPRTRSWGITYLPRCECDDAARRRGRRSEARADTLLERMYSRRGDRLPRHRWPMDDLVSLPKRRNRSQMHTGVMCLPGAQRDAIWATAPEIGCFLHRLRSRWGIRFTKAGETSELLADPVAPRHEDTRRYRSSYAGGTVVWRCAIERSWPRVAWVWLQRRGEVTVTGLQSRGSTTTLQRGHENS